MCGIAGRVNLRSRAPVGQDSVEAMCRLIAHRGPDGQGTLVDGCAGFGHRRLAIIDLSDAASQPMVSEDGRYWLVFNGEIYNFKEVRRDLEARGVRFRTSSDTEVLLASYRAFGPDCLSRLRGMFAFAVWDTATQRLFLARDRLGKKPLFYRLDQDGIAFASEAKCFLGDEGFDPRPDARALALYLAYGYVPDPWSAFEGVHKLPPAHYAIFEDGRLTTCRYWQLRYRPKSELSEAEATERLLELLGEAVRLRLISDVPLGAFLSGGVDSSVVVALMARLGTGAVRTFSIGFEDEEFDELRYARLVARRYGTVHEEFVVRPDAASVLPTLAWHYGEPFADASAIPTYYLAQLTRRHVTVALNGDAGDESFAGYTRYIPAPKAAWYGRTPAPLRRALAAAGRLAPVPQQSASLGARATRWVEVMQGSRQARYAESMMCLDSALRRRLCTNAFLAGSPDPAAVVLGAYAATDADQITDAMMHVDIQTYLPGDILVKVDIATMAHGLEGRSPFLDHELMEFAASLPVDYKLRGGEKKHLLRRAARSLVPGALLDRPKKGFSVPLARWFRGELRDLAFDVLLSHRTAQRGIVSPARVERLLRDHCEGRYDWHVPIWTLLMLELWFRECVDGRAAIRPRESLSA
jgi:asparagine synthase (glutamine-hydrolysing)